MRQCAQREPAERSPGAGTTKQAMIDVEPTELPEVLMLTPRVHGDARGFFLESYNARDFARAVGREVAFVQDNHSRSAGGVLRGLHYQVGEHAQAKLVRVLRGAIFDVAVDVRRSSPRFGRWVGARLDDQTHRQLWIPEGFAHGFLVLGDSAEVAYKASSYYAPEAERCVRFDDPDIGISWPTSNAPALSPRDAAAGRLRDAETFP
jgi:dTDP-4-dehydrorhamnose 3,5-epimerase